MAPKTKPQKTTQIRRLGIGSVFSVQEGEVTENWKIIGRPGKSGTDPVSKKPRFWVKAIYVPKSKDDEYTPSKEAKYFDLNREVVEVRPARKDFDSIDRRDQPEEVQSVEQLAKALGVEVKEGEGADLEELAETLGEDE